jgi:hypothetical protein
MFAEVAIHYAPVGPAWALIMIALAMLAAIAVGTATMLRRHAARKWAFTLGLLRVIACVLFLLILLQPSLSSTRDAQPLPELLVLVDTSRSMAQPSGGSGTRFDEVRTALERGDFATGLRERFHPHWFAFDSAAIRLDHGDLAALAATGSGTHLASSLQSAYDLLQAEDTAPRRVLLVSDGNDNGDGEIAEVARRLGVKVDELAPSAKSVQAAGTLQVAEVQAARRVLLGSETHFRVTVQAEPAPTAERKVSLRLTEDGKELQMLPIVMKAGQTEQVLMLAHRPTATGTKTYDFQLQPAQGESAAPAKKVLVQVIDSKYEVLVLEDAWRWEYKFLHRLFEDDPSFRFTALLPRGTNGFVQFASPDRRVNLVGFPQSAAELESFDLFFLGDVNPTRWPRGLAEALARLVKDEGKSLVVIAGPKLANLLEIPALYGLLPVDLNRESSTPVTGAIAVQPRADAAASPLFFQLGKDAGVLPPLDHVYPAVRKRPGATVLLEAPKHRNDYGPLIVLAEHTVGRGRVLFVGTDTLWKWHTLAAKDGPTPYTIFWQQAFRALAPQRSQIGPVQLWVAASRSHTEAGHPLQIEAEVQSAKSLPAAKVQATLTAPGGVRLPISLNADPANPARFRATIAPSEVGTYHVHASLLSEGKTVAEGSTAFQTEDARDEARDIGVDYANLRRIAAVTGGNWIDPANPTTWPTPDAETTAPVPQARTFDLWNSFALLLLLLAVLGTDWILRVMKGFV